MKTKTKKKDKTRTKAQLLRQVEKLQAKIQAMRQPDTLRQPGEHWYRLVEYFDASTITRIPAPWGGGTYMLGKLRDAFVIEVPEDAKADDIAAFMKLLQQNRIAPTVVIRPGVKFMKFEALTAEEEAKLDAANQHTGRGPESEGNRLDRIVSGSGPDSGGSDNHESDSKEG